ncbi:MAG: ATP-binding protein, partial [Bacteroidota bacterium]
NVESGSEMRELRLVLPLKDKVFVGGHGVGVGILNRKAINYPINVTIEKPVVEPPIVLLRWTADAWWGAISSDQIEVRYRMDRAAWSQWVKQSEISIRGLSDGDHLFEIQAKDIYGIIRNDIFAAAITVPAPFYKKPEYLIPFSLLIVAIIFLWLRNVRESILHSKAMQHQRLNIANDLHDEVGSNLGSIALISQRVGRKKGIPKELREELKVISTTAVQTADYIRDIVWYTNPRYDDVISLEMRLREIASKMLTGIDVNFISDDIANLDNEVLEVRRNIFLIFKEILHNIAKHSHASKVIIEFTRHPQHIQLTVNDNGVGFDKNSVSYGNGLLSMHKRAQEIGAELQIRSDETRGTTICIIFKNGVNT